MNPNNNFNNMNFNDPNQMPFGFNNPNFQPNLMNNDNNINNSMMMDQTAMRVKNIIEPYQKKIKELEEIIRQKDFQISVLKEKLSNFNFNQNQGINVPNFNINNNINMNNQMMNQGFANNIEPQINVRFIDDNNEEMVLKFGKYRKTTKLFEKYLMNKYNEINLRYYKFSFEDNKELIPGCTLEQNRITNNSIIRVKTKNNLIRLIFDYDAKKNIIVTLEESTSVCLAIIYFLFELGREDLILNIITNELPFYFIFNASQINIKSKETIKASFGNLAKIAVRITGNIIG